ncbi:MAG: rhodanese-like domain-containing protein [Bacteroidota bacterium]
MKNFVLIFLFVTCSFYKINAQDNKSTLADTVYANITVTQAKDTIAAHANDPWFVILDVRRPDEYVIKHLPEGVMLNFSSSDFATQIATLNKSKTYLIHCASGGRSGQAFTMMQNLDFKRVYNMTGGLNAWTAAAYSTTTATAPAIASLCDTIINFNNTVVNQKDSVLLTITNAANDTLIISSISSLSGTEFSSNFNSDTTIIGARDYSFYIYYSPIDPQADSTIFSIQTDGGIVDFVVKGTATSATEIANSEFTNTSVFNDLDNKEIIINTKVQDIVYSLYDITGKLVVISELEKSNKFNYYGLENGIYCLRLESKGFNKIIKLSL